MSANYYHSAPQLSVLYYITEYLRKISFFTQSRVDPFFTLTSLFFAPSALILKSLFKPPGFLQVSVKCVTYSNHANAAHYNKIDPVYPLGALNQL